MWVIKGVYVHGKLAKREAITLTVNEKGELINKDMSIHTYVNQVVVSPRIADTTRYLTLPNGHHFETDENNTIDQLIEKFGQKQLGQESKIKQILYPAILAVTLLLSWAVLHYGVPASADKVAHEIPDDIVIAQGTSAYEEIKALHFQPSKLSEARLQELNTVFESLIPPNEDGTQTYPYQLHILDSETIGVNAFAFPSGDIIITDELIELAKDNEEIMGVMLHEIAHVEKRHAMRALVQTSTLFLIAVTVSGDLASLSTVLVGLPALLLNSNYSREMESEADLYAVERLKDMGISEEKFVSILTRIYESKDDESVDDGQSSNKGYLDSHPHIKERIAKLP